MSDEHHSEPGETGGDSDHAKKPYSQQIQHSQLSALVPERVAKGVFSTGAVVLNGAYEFILDFLLRMTQPQQVAARVVLPPAVVPRLIAALTENLENYRSKFGEPHLPKLKSQSTQEQPPVEAQQFQTEPNQPAGKGSSEQQRPSQQQSAQDLYDQLKLPDEVLSGTYANAVMIGHTGTEFSFDFITSFFPRSAVSCRVYLAAPNVPRFLDSPNHSYEQYMRKTQRQVPPKPPENPPSEDTGEESE